MTRKLSKPGQVASFQKGLILALAVTVMAGCSKSNNTAAKGSVKTAKLAAGVAAQVDGKDIPTTDLEQMMKVMMQQGFEPDSTTPGATPEEQRRNFALDRLIERQVVLNAAQVAKVGPTPAELDQRVAQVKATYGIGDSLPAGMSEEMLRKNLSDDMTITQYFNKTVIDSIPVSQADLQAYYDQNQAMFAGDNRIHASHILLLVPRERRPIRRPPSRKRPRDCSPKQRKAQISPSSPENTPRIRRVRRAAAISSGSTGVRWYLNSRPRRSHSMSVRSAISRLAWCHCFGRSA